MTARVESVERRLARIELDGDIAMNKKRLYAVGASLALVLAALVVFHLGNNWFSRKAGHSLNNEHRVAKKIFRKWVKSGRFMKNLDVTYPRSGAVFPPEFPPPMFTWNDETPGAKRWAVVVETGAGSGQKIVWKGIAGKRSLRPSREDWEKIKAASVEESAVVSIIGFSGEDSEKAVSAGKILIGTSTDSVGAPIFYRDVPLPFVYAIMNPDTIRYRLGSVASDKPSRVVLQNLPVCGNCHSFSTDGKILGMDVDYANDKGSYAVVPIEDTIVLSRDKIITWSDYRRGDGDDTFGLLSQVSPDGRYAVSTVKDRSVFVPVDNLEYSQLFFPVKGILAVYDRVEKRFFALKGADDPAYVQSNPSWSPDGKWIIFARAVTVHIPGAEKSKGVLLDVNLAKDFTSYRRLLKYDLYRIPFNDGKGGKAEAVPGASADGFSNYFAKISPDGKWLVFCRAATFMLLQPDSVLYIMPAAGVSKQEVESGRWPRKMTCNTENMNSWHSWSPNGRWLVFSSKANGAYTQLWLAHVDENGSDSPPVLLEHLGNPGRACNIPEFINIPPEKTFRIVEKFLDDHNFRHQADATVKGGDLELAIKDYRKALAINPRNIEARTHMANVYMMLKKYDTAEREYIEAIRMAGEDGKENNTFIAHGNLALLYMERGDYEKAQQHNKRMVEMNPDDPGNRLRYAMSLTMTGDYPAAERQVRAALDIEPDSAMAHLWMGRILENTDRLNKARKEYDAALAGSCRNPEECSTLVQQLLPKRVFNEGLEKFLDKFCRDNPRRADAWIIKGKFHLECEQPRKALEAFRKALDIDPDIKWLKSKIAEIENRCPPAGSVKRADK